MRAGAVRRNFNWKLVRRELSYSIRDICDLFKIHPNTVLRWLRTGLKKIDDRRPFMVHGSEIIRFLTAARAARRMRCQADELLCLSCRAPRRPWERIVDVLIRNEKLLTISGLCEVCEKPMYRMGAVSRLAEYSSVFRLQQIQGSSLVRETSTLLSGDLETQQDNGSKRPS